MKALFYTNEYPPNVYGGAGVHVDYLTRELAKLCEVEVRCFGDQDEEQPNLKVKGYGWDKSGYTAPAPLQSVFGAIQRGLDFNTDVVQANVVHLHTWYTHFAGITTKLNYDIPMVLTVHSLEPLRPWKREQLAGGYDFSVWIEKTAMEMADAVIAVSQETKADILRYFNVEPARIHVIYNGIDLKEYNKVEAPEVLRKYGIDPDMPYVLFVGRITRQKGIIHLVEAIKHLNPGVQTVLCAGAPDTPEIAKEMQEAVAQANASHGNVVWIPQMLPTDEKIAVYSHARVFCCPSIYEPFGIINLEAMACGVPVVASKLGGMKEILVDGRTGFLVPLAQQTESPFDPLDPKTFSRDLAARINQLMGDEVLCKQMGAAGRLRVEQKFGWDAIARQVHGLYQNLVNQARPPHATTPLIM